MTNASRLRALDLCLLCLVVAACGKDEGSGAGGDAGGDEAGSGGSATGAGQGGSGTPTGSSGSGGRAGAASTGQSGSSGEPVAGEGGGSGAAGTGEPGGAGTSGGSCEPAPGAGAGTPLFQCSELPGTCGNCMQEKCCDLVPRCALDEDCACLATCIGTESLSGLEGCLTSCGVSGAPGFADLASCAATTCPDGGDECNAPSGLQIPPDPPSGGASSSAGIGSGALADCSFGSVPSDGSVLQLENAAGDVCVRLERRNDGPGSLANTDWTLLEMRVGPLGEVALIDGASDVCWYSSHHNFNDWAHAWSGSRHYDLKTSLADHGATPAYTLHVFEAGPLDAATCGPTAEGTCPIGEPIELFPAP